MLIMSVSCEKNGDKIAITSESPIVLKNGETFQIKASSNMPLSYFTENEFHAKVSSSGVVEGNYVGSTNIEVKNEKNSTKIKVLVEPRIDLYPTPSLDWGTSRSHIISTYGTPDKETSDGIVYNNYSNAAPMLVYLFDNSDRLKASGVVVKIAYSETLIDFLIERYQTISVGQKDYIALFIDALDIDKAKTVVAIALNGLSYLNVMYAANVDTRSTKMEETETPISETMSSTQSKIEEIIKGM